jgi:hypothetical protein
MRTNSLGRSISCRQWEGPSKHSRFLALSPFKFWGGGVGGGGGEGGGGFFLIFPDSQCVHTMFSLRF